MIMELECLLIKCIMNDKTRLKRTLRGEPLNLHKQLQVTPTFSPCLPLSK